MRFNSALVLTNDVLQALVDSGLRESRTLDFKRELVVANDAEKREFLADVSALANTGGGHLLIGVDEAEGLATELLGIDLDNPDAEMQRLENILRTGLEPRLPGVEFAWLPKTGTRGILAIHVQQSWAAPHRVVANRQFFRRNSSGKYPMDVQELRTAFGEQDRALSAIRSFRDGRASIIFNREAAIRTVGWPRAVVHVIPLSSYYQTRDFSDGDPRVWVPPLECRGSINRRYILEGFATTSYADDNGYVESYSSLLRNGVIEGVATIGREDEGRWVFLDDATRIVADGILEYLARLIDLDVPPPWFVFITLIAVKGARQYERHPSPLQRLPAFHLDIAQVPELVLGSPEEVSREALQPALAQMWNCFGLPAPEPVRD